VAAPKLIREGDLAFADVLFGDRLRPVSEAGVASLIASVETLGLIKDPIYVRRVRHRENELVLMAGAHRLTAAQRMGWETIPMRIYECNDAWATLMEIDDNLASVDLSYLELAVVLAKRKAAYEKAFPETKNGGARGNQHVGGRQNDTMSFCQSAAEKRGVSTRTIERLTRVGEALQPETVAILHAAKQHITLKMLVELTRVSDQLQTPVAQLLADAKFADVNDALNAAKGEPIPAKPPAAEQLEMRLGETFGRAPAVARERFLDQVRIDHPDLFRRVAARMTKDGEA
jgi:ParB family chromosome partitioning protein